MAAFSLLTSSPNVFPKAGVGILSTSSSVAALNFVFVGCDGATSALHAPASNRTLAAAMGDEIVNVVVERCTQAWDLHRA